MANAGTSQRPPCAVSRQTAASIARIGHAQPRALVGAMVIAGRLSDRPMDQQDDERQKNDSTRQQVLRQTRRCRRCSRNIKDRQRHADFASLKTCSLPPQRRGAFH
jgi:ADP-ribosylglycohydrolase